MEKITLAQILHLSGIQDIEKHLAYSYIISKKIDILENDFLKSYFEGFVVNNSLLMRIQQLGHSTIEDISVDMELLIPTEDKKVNGAFFTPAYIVDYILETISPNSNAKIIDPSCGSGAFLLGIIRYMRKMHHKTISNIIKDNIFGADILEYNINRSKLLITLYALSENENISANDIHLICTDSLSYNFNSQYDAVVGNPPYVKFQDMDEKTRGFLLNNYKTTRFGTFNLYFAFFELGLKLLSDNGKLGYITPNNYFTSLAGESLRTFFQDNKCIYHIVDFNATKVFDVQTYTAISFLNKSKNSIIKYSRIQDYQLPEEYLGCVQLTDNRYEDLNIKKWRLLCGEERNVIKTIETIGEPIGGLFNICVGIATLKDEVYFINPISEDTAYYHISRGGKQYRIEKELTKVLVKISDMKSQSDIEANTRRIIFPYISINGIAQSISEEQMINNYPCCYEYLLSVKEILASRGKGKHTYKPFYAYGRTQGLNRTGIKLLTPTFSKHPRFLLDKNYDGFFTNGYGIYLLPQKSVFPNPITEESNLDVIQKILNSVVMDYYVTKTSVAIEGGYPCYQKNFIEKFTIPSFSDEEIDTLKNLSDIDAIDKFLVAKYQINLPLPNRCL